MREGVSAGRPTDIFSRTVSCGKRKRKIMQCGYCVPCVIRRAALFGAGIDDETRYRHNIRDAWRDPEIRDDLLAMRLANLDVIGNLRVRAIASGPFPLGAVERDGWFGVHERGLTEFRDYLRSEGL